MERQKYKWTVCIKFEIFLIDLNSKLYVIKLVGTTRSGEIRGFSKAVILIGKEPLI